MLPVWADRPTQTGSMVDQYPIDHKRDPPAVVVVTVQLWALPRSFE
jgi:hypothetical protein